MTDISVGSLPAAVRPVARFFGFRWFEKTKHNWSARFDRAEVSGGLGLSLALCSFEDGFSLHVHLGWPNIFLKLPILQRWHREPEEVMETWGASVFREGWSEVHLNWGLRCKVVYLPWSREWVRTSHLLADGTWSHETTASRLAARGEGLDGWRQRHDFLEAHKWSAEYPYRYILRSGEVQDRVATVSVQEMEHRPRWFMWTSLFANVRRSIDVRFNDEVGERSGSWKGGCIGCGYDLRPGETPEQSLRRMEAERKF